VAQTIEILPEPLLENGVPPVVMLWLSNDGADSCRLDVLGYSDGGIPLAETGIVQVEVSDPNGVRMNFAYPSLTEDQQNAWAFDGGLPAGPYAQVLMLATTGDVWGSSGGTVVLNQDPASAEIDATFLMEDFDFSGGAAGTLAGNGSPAAGCQVDQAPTF
jgi:hypothetical protein